MTGPTREAKLSQAFVTLADTLVTSFDVVGVLQTLVETCTEVLDVQAGGLMLKNSNDRLEVVVSTTDDARLVEMVQLSAESGPCLQCFDTGAPVTIADVTETEDLWPEFTRAALDRGFRSVHATPLRLRQDVIGTLNLFGAEVGALNETDIAAAQALADVATIGILAERAAREREEVAAQLQGALDSRVVIEQAKGVLAESLQIPMDEAFVLLRRFARSNNLNLRAVAAALSERRLAPARLVSAQHRTAPSNGGSTGAR